MKIRYAAIGMAVAVLSMASVSAQGQKPSEPSKDTQHHQMMQGLTDAQFVPMMIKHHQQGIEMARVALTFVMMNYSAIAGLAALRRGREVWR